MGSPSEGTALTEAAVCADSQPGHSVAKSCHLSEFLPVLWGD